MAALANFNMSIEYIRGTDNKVADCLSRVTDRLDEDSVRELIECAKMGAKIRRGEEDDPRLVQEEAQLDNDVILHARVTLAQKSAFKNLADRHWVLAQRADPVIRHVRGWLNRPKENNQTLSEYLTGRVPDVDRLAYLR